ncbi:MAG TPA: acetyltransferase, partial [Chloroflexaceae bacterium]|nr:acetyltransferase [Chloroflexaceae bacterium]
MTDLVIVGTGGVGRAAAAIVVALNAARPRWRLLGFLDDAPERHGERVAGLTILGGADWLAGRPGVAAHVAVGAPRARRRVVERLATLGVSQFATLVHPSVQLPVSARLGPGCLVYPGAVLDVDVSVGAHAILNIGCAVCHDDQLADFATIAPGVHLGGAVRLGEGADMGIGSCTVQS